MNEVTFPDLTPPHGNGSATPASRRFLYKSFFNHKITVWTIYEGPYQKWILGAQLLEQIHSNLLLSLLTQIDLSAEGGATLVYLISLGLLYWLSVIVRDYYNLDDVNARYNLKSNWAFALQRPNNTLARRVGLLAGLLLALGGGLAGLWYLEIPYPKPGNNELAARTYFVFVIFALAVWIVYAAEVISFGVFGFRSQHGLNAMEGWWIAEQHFEVFYAEVAVAFFTLDKGDVDALIQDLWNHNIHLRIKSPGSTEPWCPTPPCALEIYDLEQKIADAKPRHLVTKPSPSSEGTPNALVKKALFETGLNSGAVSNDNPSLAVLLASSIVTDFEKRGVNDKRLKRAWKTQAALANGQVEDSVAKWLCRRFDWSEPAVGPEEVFIWDFVTPSASELPRSETIPQKVVRRTEVVDRVRHHFIDLTLPQSGQITLEEGLYDAADGRPEPEWLRKAENVYKALFAFKMGQKLVQHASDQDIEEILENSNTETYHLQRAFAEWYRDMVDSNFLLLYADIDFTTEYLPLIAATKKRLYNSNSTLDTAQLPKIWVLRHNAKVIFACTTAYSEPKTLETTRN